ncbi:TPA: NAD(+) synthase [Candidatus Thalassarchaeaceae archaeon]|nr:NAD(+) synthase [Euryarchaeota archaeon]MDG1547700.1 NAD(+) synthase [Candidatus Thalassarchaeaceae archaeon]DAC65530.1 MAG TPA: NAD(+) synthase [Candidatus Poseidoniales archaeon]MDC3326100.1 NAD(+) synthase [Euryarchaeota archaeon]MDG1554213.1 NAD(+) synthase [Candidatus Thalassarchaeaceae archaeon]|tara:strand:- start:540 stop:1316 length:777 start_codon:yes stop_codon:yes gene_type:complete
MSKWKNLSEDISNWILDYANSNNISTLVVGVSGGIDSAVTSTLCAKTGLRTLVINMPIHQNDSEYNLSNQHMMWLRSNWDNVESHIINLSKTFDVLKNELSKKEVSDIAMVNTRARIRMATLYSLAGSNNGIVVGTGNKVEDFGVGFFTKYGDGGVDISPIADMYKSEVYLLADSLGIIQEIQEAAPTDGLWSDGRTDEDQIGATYDELEWAMNEIDNPSAEKELNERLAEVMRIYLKLNSMNSHKMNPIPIFKYNKR